MEGRKGLVLFGYSPPNRYTWSVLMGFLESDIELTTHYTFLPTPFQLYDTTKHQEWYNSLDLSKYSIVVLAFSLLSIQFPHFDQGLHPTVLYFRNRHLNVVVVVGGVHVIGCPEAFTSPLIDFLIPNEGEWGFKLLLHALLDYPKDKVDLTRIAGVAKAFPFHHPVCPPKLVNLGDSPSFSLKYRLFGPIELSRGCPYRCKFCQTGIAFKKMRHAPVDKLLYWIQKGAEVKYDKLWFLTPNAFAYGSQNGTDPNPTAIYELLSKIKQIKAIKAIYFGTFPSEVRPEFVTYEILGIITPFISNKHIVIGAQTASDRLLREIARGHTFQDVINAIEILNQFNLIADIDFIFGLPGETDQDVQENLHFFQQIIDHNIKNIRIHTHTFMPLPGTAYSQEKSGKISPTLHKILGLLAKEGKAFGEHLAQAGLVPTRYTRN